jgi:integrase
MARMKKSKMKGVSCVTRNGETYWYAHIDGRKLYFGKGEDGRKSAQAAKGKHLAEKHEGRELRGGLQMKRAKIANFQELHKWYFELPDMKAQKVYGRKVQALAHLVDYFGKRPLNAFEKDEQSRYVEFRKREGAAEGTVNVEIELLSSMFHEAIKSKQFPVSVMPGQFIRNGDSAPRRTVTEDEYKRLLESANPAFRDVLVCGYESGMRSSEIINLRASQVHLDVSHISGETLDFISLGQFDTKTVAERLIPVSEELKEILIRRMQGLAPDDYVFTNGVGKSYCRKEAISRLMESVCKRAGVKYGDKTVDRHGRREGIVFHSLRHTRVTKWVESGFSDEIIRRASGHHSLNSYRRYVNIRDARPIMNLVKVSEKPDNSSIKYKEKARGLSVTA